MKSHARTHDFPHRREADRGKSWRDYLPLLVLLAATALAASAKHHAYDPMAGTTACMGTTLKVPLSTVALLEDLGMAAALWAG